jgi:hypothetical protein
MKIEVETSLVGKVFQNGNYVGSYSVSHGYDDYHWTVFDVKITEHGIQRNIAVSSGRGPNPQAAAQQALASAVSILCRDGTNDRLADVLGQEKQ